MSFNVSKTTPPSSASSMAAQPSSQGKIYCSNCHVAEADNTCGRCQAVFYCNVTCQRAHWPTHKPVCVPILTPADPSITQNSIPENRNLDLSTRVRSISPEKSTSAEEVIESEEDLRGIFQTKLQSITSQIGHNNILRFIHMCSDEKSIQCFNREGFKKVSPRSLKKLLADQEYEELLKYVWTEKDLDTRIRFLKEWADQGHAIFMLELSRALLLKNKDKSNLVESDTREARKYFIQGIHCATLDLACYHSPRLPDSPLLKKDDGVILLLRNFYLLSTGFVPPKGFVLNIKTQWKPQPTHPSPKWLLLGCKDMQLKPKNSWHHERMRAYEEEISCQKKLDD